MSDMMTFPATVEEFMEQYKIVDDEKVYTNGADLVPIFRMMQWFEHVSAMDTISRQAEIADAQSWIAVNGFEQNLQNKVIEWLKEFPSAQPETTTMTVGRTKGEITMWYECDNCGEPVDQSDNYCRKCGRKFR